MPDVSTEVAIATTTLGSANTTITFSSIPSTYTHLRIVLTATYAGTTSSGGQLSFNGAPSGTLYSYTRFYGQGGSTATALNSSQPAITPADTSWVTGNAPDFYTYDIFSYAGSTFKPVLTTNSQDKNGSGSIGIKIGLWRSTTAITSCVLTSSSQSFQAGTTATLYGIL